MEVRRADRRAQRRSRAEEEFGSDADAVLDLLELTELAWHDCFWDTSPPQDVIDDLFLVADGHLPELIRAARLAVTDYRDLRIAADLIRASR